MSYTILRSANAVPRPLCRYWSRGGMYMYTWNAGKILGHDRYEVGPKKSVLIIASVVAMVVVTAVVVGRHSRGPSLVDSKRAVARRIPEPRYEVPGSWDHRTGDYHH